MFPAAAALGQIHFVNASASGPQTTSSQWKFTGPPAIDVLSSRTSKPTPPIGLLKAWSGLKKSGCLSSIFPHENRARVAQVSFCQGFERFGCSAPCSTTTTAGPESEAFHYRCGVRPQWSRLTAALVFQTDKPDANGVRNYGSRADSGVSHRSTEKITTL